MTKYERQGKRLRRGDADTEGGGFFGQADDAGHRQRNACAVQVPVLRLRV